jgi:glycosyltransferase involved in cell wall biosynthesis
MRMIFHHPLPVAPGSASASGIRPLQMMEAFRSLGIEVDAVCGYAAERAQAMARVERYIDQGVPYAFMYGESSTEPTLLTDRHHLPLNPLLDFGFFARLRSRAIPLGVFYRDIYWRFPGYGPMLPLWKRWGAKLFYRYDLLQYRRLLDRLYLPSMAMAAHVPWFDRARMVALPPGFADQALPASPPARKLRLLYVGGIGDHYRMHELFRALGMASAAELTVCTREADWLAVCQEYPVGAAGNVRIVHRSGAQLQELIANADLGVICVDPHAYWTFAAPVKLYEYLGAGKPVLASQGTLAADFVEREGIGWGVPYKASAIAQLLDTLASDRMALERKRARVQAIRETHTWQARARTVVADLVST